MSAVAVKTHNSINLTNYVMRHSNCALQNVNNASEGKFIFVLLRSVCGIEIQDVYT